ALNGHIAAVTELIDVVLHAPDLARLPHQIGSDLGGHDLVSTARGAMGHDRAVEVHDHRLTHGIKGAVRAAHADICRHHEIAEGICLVGEAPGVADRRRIAGSADHYLRALVGAFPRHLREHAVMTDDERELAAPWPVDDGNTEIAWLPRLDRNPGMHLAIVELQLARVSDDYARCIRHGAGVQLHEREA